VINLHPLQELQESLPTTTTTTTSSMFPHQHEILHHLEESMLQLTIKLQQAHQELKQISFLNINDVTHKKLKTLCRSISLLSKTLKEVNSTYNNMLRVAQKNDYHRR